MSLKAFHVLFVAASTLLAFVFAGWSARAWRAGAGGGYLSLAIGSAVVGVLLVVYGFWFRRKISTQEEERRRRRKMIHGAAVAVAMFLASSPRAHACSTCYGQAEGPLIDAARLGVWLLFGLVLAVQLSFAWFFIRIWQRSRKTEPRTYPPGRSVHP